MKQAEKSVPSGRRAGTASAAAPEVWLRRETVSSPSPRPSSTRLDTLCALARAARADALFVTHPPTVRWATGFTGSNALVVVTPAEAHVVTDGRYREQAHDEVRVATVHIAPAALARYAAEHGLLGDAATVAFQPDHVTVATREQWATAFPETAFVGVGEGLAEAIAAKDAVAIDAMRHAQAQTVLIFERVTALVQPGVTERDVAAELTLAHLRAGASAMSFEPIVATGARGALPHGRPTDTRIAPGDLVVIDVGGVFDGYCSDFTRTLAVGEPGPEARADHAAVARAHDAGIAALHGGALGSDADRAARRVLAEAGLDEWFTHSLGHGVGMEVHEWPRLSSQVDHTIPEGATVTVEPGVYRPGRWGIRTESLVWVRDGGADVLAPYPTELQVI